jgi:hypothetical protein
LTFPFFVSGGKYGGREALASRRLETLTRYPRTASGVHVRLEMIIIRIIMIIIVKILMMPNRTEDLGADDDRCCRSTVRGYLDATVNWKETLSRRCLQEQPSGIASG